MKITAKQLAKQATKIAREYKTTYIWGGIGQPITASTVRQAINQYPKNKTYEPKAMDLVGQRKAFYFDCVGLIKSILWGWSGDSSKSRGGAGYASNGVPDISADQMIAKCVDISTEFDEIQVGELLWCKGHVGIYIGEGLAVECTPKWDCGVQITAVGNIGSKYGYKTRIWTKHGKLPYVTYTSAQDKAEASQGRIEPAQGFKASYAKTYTVKAFLLNMRRGPGVTKGILRTLRKGDKVVCYGYYTQKGNTTWLYAVDKETGATGFVSMKYLK